MREHKEILIHAIVIGTGATEAMDLWATILWHALKVPSLDYVLLGRWIGHLPRGKFRHKSIKAAK